MWLSPKPLMSPDNLRSMQVDNICGSNCRLPANWKPTALEAIAPTYIAHNTPKGKLDGFRYRAGRLSAPAADENLHRWRRGS